MLNYVSAKTLQDSLIKIIYAQRYNEGQIIIGFFLKIIQFNDILCRAAQILNVKGGLKDYKRHRFFLSMLKSLLFQSKIRRERNR